MHLRAKRTLEVVVVNDDDLSFFVAALRTSSNVDGFHHVFADVELLPLDQRLVVLRH